MQALYEMADKIGARLKVRKETVAVTEALIVDIGLFIAPNEN